MRGTVAIDTRWLNVQAGVAQQISGLLQGLAAQDRQQDYLLFGFNPGIQQANFRHYDLTGWRRKIYQGLWKTMHWPSLEQLIGEHDLVHFTNGTMVPVRNRQAKKVLTIHDLAFLHYPETLERRNLRFMRRFCPAAIQQADKIIAVSQYTKNDILNNFNVQGSRIVVIPNAADPIFSLPSQPASVAAVKHKYQIQKPYILFVGTLEPRKNVQLLLRAAQQLPPALQEQYAVVLVGMKGWQQSAWQQQVADLGQKMTVQLPGYVPKDELVNLYAGATLFVLPSLFEGFGIPILEAMACGTPVLAANNSSLPEVTGEAGVLFAHNDAADLAAKLGQLLGDEARRGVLRQRGLVQAQRFSWLASGAKLKALYEELLA